MGLVEFSQIHPWAFAHPSDRKATATLEKVPFLPDLLKKAAQLAAEEKFRAHHMFHSIELKGQQLYSLRNMVHEVAERLGVPIPTVYVSREGGINAFAFGMDRYSIILTSGLVDLMTDDELKAIIAHELAHILSEHMLYRGVGMALASGAMSSVTKFGPATLLGESLSRLFYAWYRAAEYTADRAALLALQSPDHLASAMARLAGVPRRFLDEFDLSQFAAQVQDYEDSATLWSRIVTFDMKAFMTHPEPARRALAILEWSKSDDYRNILQGRYLTRTAAKGLEQVQIEGLKSCPLCWSPVGELATCAHCGLVQNPDGHKPCSKSHPNNLDWKFCKTCGEKLGP